MELSLLLEYFPPHLRNKIGQRLVQRGLLQVDIEVLPISIYYVTYLGMYQPGKLIIKPCCIQPSAPLRICDIHY